MREFALLKLSIKLISGLCFSYLTNLFCGRRIKASSDFVVRILGHHHHHLHEELSKSRSHTSTRSRFKLLASKTAAYRNSVLPALLRFLVDRKSELNYYLCIIFPSTFYCLSKKKRTKRLSKKNKELTCI